MASIFWAFNAKFRLHNSCTNAPEQGLFAQQGRNSSDRSLLILG
jgi:hypothetical protein